jgi:hypothetical protein
VILDQAETQLVTSVGWVEHGAFLVWDLDSDETRPIPVEDADYVTLHPGRADHFAVVHHRRHGGFAVSVRHFSSPDQVLATAAVNGGRAEVEGDREAWPRVPRAYSGYDPDAESAYTLLLVDGSAVPEAQRMTWFNGDTYDLGYQGMGSPVEIPGENVVLIPIQRSSQPVIYDVVSRQVVGHLKLADRGGNPSLRFRTQDELWADDYDTLLLLDREGWVKRGELFLQPAVDGVGQFIGGWTFDRNRTLCAVGRPFSGDVLGIETESFTITSRASLGDQPLDVAVLADGRVFARDWQSGRTLRGTLRPIGPSEVP